VIRIAGNPTPRSQQLKENQAIHSRQIVVGDEAAAFGYVFVTKQGASGGVHLHGKSLDLQCELEGVAHRGVVVDHEDR
jgi:hypothetical protein